jgi:hypothetical protein
MRSILGSVQFATALLAISLVHSSAQGAPINADGIRATADTLKLVAPAQYIWNGRSYCWYDSGWKGPGWYVCSYGPWVSGLWWGGGHGWHNWSWHGKHHVEHHKGGNKGHHVEHHKGGKNRAHVAHRGGGKAYRGHHVQHYGGKRPGGGHVRHYGGGRHHGGAALRGGGHRGGASFRGGGHRGGGGRGGGRRSDLRLKEDIVPLARLNNGLELYRFRYKGSDRTEYVGVMAQEVQKIEPNAVWRDRSGYLVVDYDRLGLRFMTWKEWLTRTPSE